MDAERAATSASEYAGTRDEADAGQRRGLDHAHAGGPALPECRELNAKTPKYGRVHECERIVGVARLGQFGHHAQRLGGVRKRQSPSGPRERSPGVVAEVQDHVLGAKLDVGEREVSRLDQQADTRNNTCL